MLSLAILLTAPAHACGGFFCDNVDPVVQRAERILFLEEDAGDWTTFVEVQFEGPPSEFAWVVPIPMALDPQTEIDIAPAGLFDDLEAATAPRFEDPSAGAADVAYIGAGCSCYGPWEPGFWGADFAPDTSGVDVVGEAVVGPYDLEVITAEEADNLVSWLQGEGYQIPFSAVAAIDHYVQQDYAFLGLKLLPDTPSGPIDTLVLRCGAEQPLVPLVLTSVAAAPDMEIVAYVLAGERYVPDNYADLAYDYGRVRWVGDGMTDYEWYLLEDIEAAGGQAFNTEFAQPVAHVLRDLSDETVAVLGSGTYLTRFRTFMDGWDRTVDPTWVPDPGAPDVANVHAIGLDDTARAGLPAGLALGLVWLGVVAWRRRSAR